jgi:hypothetical protein
MVAPWVASQYSTHGTEVSAAVVTAARAAIRRADADAQAAFDTVAYGRDAPVADTHAAACVAKAAYSAARTARTAAAVDDTRKQPCFEAANAVVDAARAAAGLASDIGNAADADAGLIDRGESPAALAARPLWLTETPTWVHAAWLRLEEALLNESPDWKVWTDWYRARLVGGRAIEAGDVAHVLIAEQIWKKGSQAVNAEIARLIEDIPAGLPVDAVVEQTQATARPDFSDRDAAERWLRNRPEEAAMIFVARAALRVAPLLADALRPRGDGATSVGREVILPTFRAMAAPWLRGLGHGFDAVSANHAAHAAAPNAADAGRLVAVARAAAAASTGGRKAAVAARGASAVVHAVTAMPAATAAIAIAAAADAELIDRGESALALASRPLWLTETPTWAHNAWLRLQQALLKDNKDWRVWTDWYRARLAGGRAIEARDVVHAMIGNDIWEQGPRAVNAEIGRLIAEYSPPGPLPDIPSAFGFGWTDAGTITVVSSSADWPAFPVPTSEKEHRDRLEACRTLASDLASTLNEQLYQVRPEYSNCLNKYSSRLPVNPGDGNILLADAEARTLRSLFAADTNVLAAGFASQLKTFLEHHIGLRPYYPEIEKFYRDVQSGRIETPLPQDAVEGIVRGIKAHTSIVFDRSVTTAIEESAQPAPSIATPPADELPTPDPNQVMPPADPLKEIDPKKARDFAFGGIVNALWKVFLEGEKVPKAGEGWRAAANTLQPYVSAILEWLKSFTGS